MSTVTGPPPSAELMSPAELAALKFKSADRIRRALADGSLHGHRDRDTRGARWAVPYAVAVAWKAGRGPADQQRACPLCGPPTVTPMRRRTG